MENNHSYDSGKKPFKHDENRGKWSSKWDFYLASIGHGYGVRNFIIFHFLQQRLFTVGFVVMFTIYAFLFVIPLYFVQSSIGQFSGTGVISVFRISPLFKGVGYCILLLNVVTASYHSIMASYPLWYFFMSFSSELPWMTCSNEWNTQNCTINFSSYEHISPSMEYFQRHILQHNKEGYITHIFWPILGCALFVWTLVYFCNRDGVKSIGLIIRYTTISAIAILFLLFIRCLCLPNIWENIQYYFSFDWSWFLLPDLHLGVLTYMILTLGSGWGAVMTMSSYNDFKLNTIKYSIIIPFFSLGLTMIAEFLMFAAEDFLMPDSYWINKSYSDHIFAMLPFFFGKIGASQMWSLLFFLMIFLCEINAFMIQVFTILTAIFDEYEFLRNYKKHVTMGLCAILSLTTFLYANNTAYSISNSFALLPVFMQMIICFIELIIVVWIYGRLRFQRDIEFMLGRKIKTWIFYIIRFITPIFPGFVTVLLFILPIHLILENIFMKVFVIIFLRILPLVLVIGYIIYQLWTTTGTIPDRIRKCVRPRDWYPASPTDREIYERSIDASEVSQQLLEMDDPPNGIIVS